jgi:hypothetical protein
MNIKNIIKLEFIKLYEVYIHKMKTLTAKYFYYQLI